MYPSSRLIASRTKAPSNLLLKLLRASTGFGLATGSSAHSTSAQDKLESELKSELKSATKTMLGSIAPSLRDAIDVESVSKEMLAELQAKSAGQAREKRRLAQEKSEAESLFTKVPLNFSAGSHHTISFPLY